MPLEHRVHRFGAQPLPTGEHDFTLQVSAAGRDAGRGPAGDVDRAQRRAAGAGGHRPARGPRGPRARRRGADLAGPAHSATPAAVTTSQRRKLSPPKPAGLTRGVLMRSYFGETATDNGVSIQKELQRRGSDLPVYWAVQDHSVVVPDGGIPVVVNSREWYRLLSSVSYYVDNMYQPEYHRKPEGQVIVQTFHGYPFKQMGHPHWRTCSSRRPASRLRRARPRMGLPGLPGPLRHSAAGPRLRLSRRGAGDRLPPQRRAPVRRGRRDPGADARLPGHRARPDRRALCPDLPRLPRRGTTWRDGRLPRLRGR